MKTNCFDGDMLKDTEVSSTNDHRDNPGKNSGIYKSSRRECFASTKTSLLFNVANWRFIKTQTFWPLPRLCQLFPRCKCHRISRHIRTYSKFEITVL